MDFLTELWQLMQFAVQQLKKFVHEVWWVYFSFFLFVFDSIIRYLHLCFALKPKRINEAAS